MTENRTPAIPMPEDDDRFHVPDELRDYYEPPLWSDWSKAHDPLTSDRIALHMIREELSQDRQAQREKLPMPTYPGAPDNSIRAWLYQPTEEEYRFAIDALTDDDRLWWLHHLALVKAEERRQEHEKRQARREDNRARLTCCVCGVVSPQARPTSVAYNRVVVAGGTPHPGQAACPPCAAAVDAELLRRASQEQVDRQTRAALAADYLDRIAR